MLPNDRRISILVTLFCAASYGIMKQIFISKEPWQKSNEGISSLGAVPSGKGLGQNEYSL